MLDIYLSVAVILGMSFFLVGLLVVSCYLLARVIVSGLRTLTFWRQ